MSVYCAHLRTSTCIEVEICGVRVSGPGLRPGLVRRGRGRRRVERGVRLRQLMQRGRLHQQRRREEVRPED